MAEPEPTAIETPGAVQAIGQSRAGATGAASAGRGIRQPDEDRLYKIDKRVENAARTRVWERRKGDPVYRPLEIFALNPEVSKLEGGVVSLSVPYEALDSGPVGSVFAVVNEDADGQPLARADLEAPFVLMRGGYSASLSRPEFHQQMVYAIAMLTYTNFTAALGRNVAWAFEPPDDPAEPNRLILKPHGAETENAWYDGETGEIVFGYFKPKQSTPVVPKDAGHLFTCMSHDIIVHEMTHALLDGLRAHFNYPTHQQSLAFHEALADLIAFFQHFTFEDVVRTQLAKAHGNLEKAINLIHIAKEFGRGLGLPDGTLRSVWETSGDAESAERLILNDELEKPHELGRVLIYAIFDAFLIIYKRKAKRYFRLATGGTGVLPDGDIPTGLTTFLVDEVRDLADQFLSICIRAIDYCPPVDVRFGDYLRALITADRDVVPDDKWAYREAIIQAFGKRRIYGQGTASMTEDALTWNRPRIAIEPQKRLSFGKMRFDADPGRPASAAEMCIQAGIVGRLVSRPEYAREFGIVAPGTEPFSDGSYELPEVNSVRPLRRIGPEKQVVFDLVAEVTQRRLFRKDGREMTVYGGSTIIFGARGEVRYIISKRVDQDDRANEQFEFAQSSTGQKFWTEGQSGFSLNRDALRKMCVTLGKSGK